MIARDLGWGSVERMRDGLSARALTWWKALYEVENEEREEQVKEAMGSRQTGLRRR